MVRSGIRAEFVIRAFPCAHGRGKLKHKPGWTLSHPESYETFIPNLRETVQDGLLWLIQ